MWLNNTSSLSSDQELRSMDNANIETQAEEQGEKNKSKSKSS
ncbi:putative poly(Hydroxyalcanoate) granule associated domain protein, partial [Acinetobacter baumannii 45002_8]